MGSDVDPRADCYDDVDQLLAFYDYPAEHRVRLCTTNPIESTFATVRHRTKVTKGPGSRAAGLAMAFKLIESAQSHWRAVNAPISSRSSAPVPASRTGNSSNDSTTMHHRQPPKRSSATGHDFLRSSSSWVERACRGGNLRESCAGGGEPMQDGFGSAVDQGTAQPVQGSVAA
jgi:hypothetical protein